MSITIHHVQIAIPEGCEDKAREFYSQILLLTEVPKPPTLASRGGAWFSTGNLELHLGIDPNFSPSTKAHVAFLVDDLDGIKHRLLQYGVRVIDDHLLPGFTRFYTEDPFGNRIEILQIQEEKV